MNKNYIGENIRIYRERKNITQRELGERVGKTWEMISRYERGISSPFKQIDVLADALNVDVGDLLKDPTEKISPEHRFNRAPLFTSIPRNLDFINTKSYIYYSVPDWILDIDIDCFVIDSNLLDIKILEIKSNGYFFISPNSKIEKGDIVIKKENDTVVLSNFGNKDEKDIIGKVLAQEIRL